MQRRRACERRREAAAGKQRVAAGKRRVAAAGVQAAAGVRAVVEMKFEQALAMERFIYCYVSLI